MCSRSLDRTEVMEDGPEVSGDRGVVYLRYEENYCGLPLLNCNLAVQFRTRAQNRVTIDPPPLLSFLSNGKIVGRSAHRRLLVRSLIILNLVRHRSLIAFLLWFVWK